MIPNSASKYDQIIADLNRINEQIDLSPFVFELNRHKNDAKKLIETNPEHAYIILGIIACIEDDVDLMHRYHKNAIQCSGKSSHSLYQYGSSLMSQDMNFEAYRYTKKAYERTPETKIIIEQMMSLAFVLEKDDEYNEYKKKLTKLKFKFTDLEAFPEDDPKILQKMVGAVDVLLNENPEMIHKPDPALEALVDELIEGVELD